MTTSAHTHFDPTGIDRLIASIEADIKNSVYDGAVVKIARHGELVVDEALGYADRKAGRPAKSDDVFKVLSLSKAFINVLTLQAIDRGMLALTTRVVDVLPEFWGSDKYRSAGKDRVNIGHLLTHRAGLPGTPQPVPYEQLHDFDATLAAIYELDVVGEPGKSLNYSPTLNHALLGEIVRRVYGGDRSIREVLRQELFEPLAMTSSSLGEVPALSDRVVPLTSDYPEGGWLTNDDFQRVARAISAEDSQMPWVGGLSSAGDVFRFAEMLRRGGELDGTRVLSPAIIDKATTLQTGAAPNDLYRLLADLRGWDVPPGNFGLGFALSGEGLTVSQFGTLTSPRTYGNFGAGSTLFWVDPERDITFVCLTSRAIEESENILRFQRLSDLTISAARD
ncbi:Beta-lactamase class C and other penicillin binding proteins [Rhodococcus wratislaviensis]|uniref:Beta-lactamase class C and other penicillin binding proteins n=1 Tax=Rhodococcus wratislaviensis TaxID=44752 RepID=A0A402CL92_RHOWR|nr:serine hydrolase domain-containing protein [Rhodococcus wratislaviensis]GCE44371.1 Beta-lactamase class C and other penicillin binding proteins [Rhodococcus wratislaviensis]